MYGLLKRREGGEGDQLVFLYIGVTKLISYEYPRYKEPCQNLALALTSASSSVISRQESSFISQFLVFRSHKKWRLVIFDVRASFGCEQSIVHGLRPGCKKKKHSYVLCSELS